MDYLKRIRQKIDDFCINKMRMDGAQHLIAGILIYDMLKYLMPVEAAILTTLVILVAKEIGSTLIITQTRFTSIIFNACTINRVLVTFL